MVLEGKGSSVNGIDNKQNVERKRAVTQEVQKVKRSNFILHLSRYIGETVTIFITSGGESGLGFTGVILSVNSDYVRLVTRIGPAPSCPLGNSCICINNSNKLEDEVIQSENKNCNIISNTLGSITDIPINKIAAFTHNTI